MIVSMIVSMMVYMTVYMTVYMMQKFDVQLTGNKDDMFLSQAGRESIYLPNSSKLDWLKFVVENFTGHNHKVFK